MKIIIITTLITFVLLIYFSIKNLKTAGIITAIICILEVIGCFLYLINEQSEDKKPKTTINNKINNKVIIITVDSCEYITIPCYGGWNIIHKDNCKNHKL